MTMCNAAICQFNNSSSILLGCMSYTTSTQLLPCDAATCILRLTNIQMQNSSNSAKLQLVVCWSANWLTNKFASTDHAMQDHALCSYCRGRHGVVASGGSVSKQGKKKANEDLQPPASLLAFSTKVKHYMDFTCVAQYRGL